MAGDTSGGEAIPNTMMDAEQQSELQERAAKEKKISRIAIKIVEILEEENLTCGEWGEIVELFSMRIGAMVSNVKIKTLK